MGKKRGKKTLLQVAASQSVTAQCGIRVTGLLLISTDSCFQTQVSKLSSWRQICPVAVAVPHKTARLPSLLVLFHSSAFWARHWLFSISLESHRNVGSGASCHHVLRYHILLTLLPASASQSFELHLHHCVLSAYGHCWIGLNQSRTLLFCKLI